MFVRLLAQVIMNINLNLVADYPRIFFWYNLRLVNSWSMSNVYPAIGRDLKNKTFITNDYFVKGGKPWSLLNSYFGTESFEIRDFHSAEPRPKSMRRHMEIRNSNIILWNNKSDEWFSLWTRSFNKIAQFGFRRRFKVRFTVKWKV